MLKLVCALTLISSFIAPCRADVVLPENITKQFITKIAKKHQLPIEYVQQNLALAEKNQLVIDAINKPWEAKPWHQYRPIFITEKRIEHAAKFWQEHKQTLEKAEAIYGVPAQIIVAIIGVESFFGRYLGQYSVLDSLYTLGFHRKSRSSFFKAELGEFLALCYQQQFDVKAIKGSYAGAMGWSQFIASSYRHYAVDFNDDGKIDLINSPEDAIGSIAHYLKKNGWQKNKPIAVSGIVIDEKKSAKIVASTKADKPKSTLAMIRKKGLKPATEILSSDKVTLLAFELEDGLDYWLGFGNFYTITRYNHSPLYAMAVFQLSEEIKQQIQNYETL